MPSAYSTHIHTHTDTRVPLNWYTAVYRYTYETNLSCVVLLRGIDFPKPSVIKPNTRFKIQKILRGAHIAFMCFVWIPEQTAFLPYVTLTD